MVPELNPRICPKLKGMPIRVEWANDEPFVVVGVETQRMAIQRLRGLLVVDRHFRDQRQPLHLRRRAWSVGVVPTNRVQACMQCHGSRRTERPGELPSWKRLLQRSARRVKFVAEINAMIAVNTPTTARDLPVLAIRVPAAPSSYNLSPFR